MLSIQTKAPDFNLPDSLGNMRSLNEFKGKKVLIYFYPKDLTSGCSMQAQNYRDEYENFNDNNVIVIGISKDSVKSHVKFVEKYNLPFILLSDEGLDAIKAYDVWHEKSLYGNKFMGVVRTTYLIDENGIIIYANDKVKAKEDATCMVKRIK